MEGVRPVKDRRRNIWVCPDCGHDEFHYGPRGAGSQNVECAGCETRWNANSFGLPWERLSTIWERLEKKHDRRKLAHQIDIVFDAGQQYALSGAREDPHQESAMAQIRKVQGGIAIHALIGEAIEIVIDELLLEAADR